jgi:hypothetical protein
VDSRALLRRAFPYLVIGIGGFALAYVIIFVFVLPSRIIPPPKQPAPDTATVLQPIDTTTLPPPDTETIQQAIVPMARAPEAAPDLGPTDVPDLQGMALSDARAVLNSYRLQASVRHDTSSFQPPNTVLRQSPAAGERIASGETVTLTVSYFPPEPAAGSTSTVPGALPPVNPATLTPAPRSVPPAGSSAIDSLRRIPRRPLPPIIPTDSAVRPTPAPRPAIPTRPAPQSPVRPDSSPTPAPTRFPR